MLNASEVLSMVNTRLDSNGSQFFIISDNAQLELGLVIEKLREKFIIADSGQISQKITHHHPILPVGRIQADRDRRSYNWVLIRSGLWLLHRPSTQEQLAVVGISLLILQSQGTGLQLTDECKSSFMDMKWKKVHRYILFKIDEKSRQVTVDKVGGPGEGYDNLAASLPNDDCRYAVFDFDFVTNDNCRKSKIFFIAWAPAASRIREKMLYATSKDGLRRELDGIHYEVQATDPTEMGFDVIQDRAK
ncbi:hypothetical protein SAY87_011336 [Trapa incisa]|uniref:ADF-H domain-containing protein n=1 Tax=Trapa incisa TaxID=236973 RepID=A0AAN7GMT6_9MYRT|nr:hypothetical protein SAY87_011336 [Trapa incisa]